MPELSASTGWNGGGSYGRAKDRRTGKGKRYAKPGTRDLEF